MSFVERREDRVYTYLSKKRITPKRLLFIVGMFLIWLVLLTDDERTDVASAVGDAVLLKFTLPPKIELGFQSVRSAFLDLIFVKLVVAAFFSGAGVYALRLFLYQHVGLLQEKYDPEEIKRLVALINEKTGIEKIFPCKEGKPAINQPYAAEIMKELRNSGSLKLLSIAGYENIGKGESKSLFYDFLKENQGVDLVVIQLDPSSKTISERVDQLRKTNPSYTSDQLKKEIETTKNKMNKLKVARGKNAKTKLYQCKFHPIFRLIILDHCLFMNTYEDAIHGHTSPMYKIAKVKSPSSGDLSLYNSFDCLFENICTNSQLIV